jgi:chromate transporter
MIAKLFDLILAFLKIGVSSFGGGYAALAVIQSIIVDQYHWIDINTFSDMVTISQMTPGPIGINGATFVGIKYAGLIGGVTATMAFILPSLIICSILGHIYLKYGEVTIIKLIIKAMRPVVIGVVFAAGINLLEPALFDSLVISFSNLNYFSLILFLVLFVVTFKFKKLSPVIVMLLGGIINLLFSIII